MKPQRRGDRSKNHENAGRMDTMGDSQMQRDYITEGYDDEHPQEGLFSSITISD